MLKYRLIVSRTYYPYTSTNYKQLYADETERVSNVVFKLINEIVDYGGIIDPYSRYFDPNNFDSFYFYVESGKFTIEFSEKLKEIGASSITRY